MPYKPCRNCGRDASYQRETVVPAHWDCMGCGECEVIPRPREGKPRAGGIPADIENAFSQWRSHEIQARPFNVERYKGAVDANRRVTPWLEQVQANERQRRAALLACQAIVDVAESMSDDPQEAWLADAVTLARKALGIDNETGD